VTGSHRSEYVIMIGETFMNLRVKLTILCFWTDMCIFNLYFVHLQLWFV